MSNSDLVDQRAPVVFRRVSTLVWAGIVTFAFVLIACLIATAFVHNGFFSLIAPFAVVTPFVTFALIGMALPYAKLADDVMIVRNTYATYTIPYKLIKEVVQIRIGLFILVHSGRKIPVTAYASAGNSSRAFGHKKSNARLTDLIEDKVSWASSDAGDATVTRTVDVRNFVITAAALVVPAIVILLATLTYHS